MQILKTCQAVNVLSDASCDLCGPQLFLIVLCLSQPNFKCTTKTGFNLLRAKICTKTQQLIPADTKPVGCAMMMLEVLMQEIPLMYQLLVSGNQQHVEERSWMLHLLAAGLRSPLDTHLYRSALTHPALRHPALPCLARPALPCPALYHHLSHLHLPCPAAPCSAQLQNRSCLRCSFACAALVFATCLVVYRFCTKYTYLDAVLHR